MASLPGDFGVSIDAESFERRFVELHKQLFASVEPAFDDVTNHVFAPPKGMSQFDHSLIHDGGRWHLFYGTGDQRLQPTWHERIIARDWEGANKVTCEPGNGHAVGQTLSDLEFKDHVFFEPQGRFDLASRSVCSVFRYDGRFGMLYDVRGADDDDNLFIGMSLAWSNDLEHWELGKTNPVIAPPPWACKGSTCKDPHVMCLDGVYLIYYVVMDTEGYCSVALTTTTDWNEFSDAGCVFRSAPMLRGTLGIESPCVVHREGIWHLFFTQGQGMWHAVSSSPTSFVARRDSAMNVGRGVYFVGHFHATEIVCAPDGAWWLTTDRKEQARLLNRRAGRLCYRGTYEDEKVLEEGLYLSRIDWRGDQPVLEKP